MTDKNEVLHPTVTLESLSTDQFLELVGKRVLKHRKARGMTRSSLAKESGVSVRYLAELEAGRCNISIVLLRKTAVTLGLPLDKLMAENTVEVRVEKLS